MKINIILNNYYLIVIKDKTNKIIFTDHNNKIIYYFKKNNIYKIIINNICIPIYINNTIPNTLFINIKYDYLKKFVLTDYNYNGLPITKGEIIFGNN